MLSSQSASRLKYSALASFVLICLAVVTLTPWQPVYKPSPNANSTTETKIGQYHLFLSLQYPAIQEDLALTDEQIVKIAKIKQIPIPVTFSEAIAPLKTVLTDEQLTKFKRQIFPTLMVRAFSVSEVEDALELTPEQKASIAAIQANLKTRLQPSTNVLCPRRFVVSPEVCLTCSVPGGFPGGSRLSRGSQVLSSNDAR